VARGRGFSWARKYRGVRAVGRHGRLLLNQPARDYRLKRTLRILGTRGVPAAHGGFETFAEHLALYLVARGWRVIVYRQENGNGSIREDTWQGIERITIPISRSGPKGTILFDWKAIRHAAANPDLCLTLGYNTAVLCALLRLKRVPNLINMDGIEWRRAKWGAAAKAWFWFNDLAACFLANHLIADHPEICRHLLRRAADQKITTIAYGAKRLEAVPDTEVRRIGLVPGRYLSLIARAEPENSVLEMVKGFSKRRRGVQLVVLGSYDPRYPYHAAVKQAASDEVRFLGAIYDKPVVEALRFHGLAYVHGHRVGGTNPSLVEALGAGNAVIAHGNRFNRWVAGPGARYFQSADEFSDVLDALLGDSAVLAEMRAASVARFEGGLTWDHVLMQYEGLLERWLPKQRLKKLAPQDDPSAVVFDPIEKDARELSIARMDGVASMTEREQT
jgi:glycosyltransferase involved in cell wall biosynthesis